MNHVRPIPTSYRVVPGRFPAGEYPRNLDHAAWLAKLKALPETGITALASDPKYWTDG